MKECDFTSYKMLEVMDDKEVQGKLFKVFKGEIENFKNNKDNIIDEGDDQLDPDHLFRMIDMHTERNPEEGECDVENEWDANIHQDTLRNARF